MDKAYCKCCKYYDGDSCCTKNNIRVDCHDTCNDFVAANGNKLGKIFALGALAAGMTYGGYNSEIDNEDET